MATAVVMPKQGQSVESCIIVEWKKQPGDTVAEGDALCDVETDKATIEVVSPVGGTLLAHFFAEGDDVPVLTNIAAVGAPGEAVDALRPAGVAPVAVAPPVEAPAQAVAAAPTPSAAGAVGVSPRARGLAERAGVDVAQVQGTGPSGRVIERDIVAAAAEQPKLSPVAKAMVEKGGFAAPAQGSGPGGRVMARDLAEPMAASSPAPVAAEESVAEVLDVTPVRGVRKLIADRMLGSLLSTAQLTMHARADARAFLALRKRFKASDEALGLQGVTLNDLVLFAAARTLPRFPDLNAVLQDNAITRFRPVHLGFAVDTPRGLLVPVILRANQLSLAALAAESKRLAAAAQKGTIAPDELVGGTFTVTNLGSLGIEQFTPILNVPQVAILGVGSIDLKPVADDAGEVSFVPHIGLSLTVNHQVVDGAPGARFLQALAQGIAQMDLLLAI